MTPFISIMHCQILVHIMFMLIEMWTQLDKWKQQKQTCENHRHEMHNSLWLNTSKAAIKAVVTSKWGRASNSKIVTFLRECRLTQSNFVSGINQCPLGNPLPDIFSCVHKASRRAEACMIIIHLVNELLKILEHSALFSLAPYCSDHSFLMCETLTTDAAIGTLYVCGETWIPILSFIYFF